MIRAFVLLLLFLLPDLWAEKYIVTFRERADLQVAQSAADRGREVVAALQVIANRSQGPAHGLCQAFGVACETNWAGNVLILTDSPSGLLNALRRLPNVIEVRPERAYPLIQPIGGSSAIPQNVEWGVAKIRAPEVWEFTRSAGIRVANIDTGVDARHPALSDNYSGLWGDPENVCGGVPCSWDDHGTHTMGTMVGSGGIGVAPGATWMACKGCGGVFCRDVPLLGCGQWILDPHGDGSGRDQPHVVNNSWGQVQPGFYDSIIDAWVAAGIVPVFAAGNLGDYGCGQTISPGNYLRAFSVGATTSLDVIAWFSSRGPFLGAWSDPPVPDIIKPDVVAPGENVRSSTLNGYGVLSGTSMATPHVAGTVALLWSAVPALVGNVAGTREVLEQSALHMYSEEACYGTPGSSLPNNTYGWGRIDAKAALDLALALYPSPVQIIPSSATVAPKGTVQFAANMPVSWSASVGSISATGLYQAPAANKDTSVLVRAVSTADPSLSATATVEIRKR